jgi:eukaryotic-like serine/threonine-protein kinase
MGVAFSPDGTHLLTGDARVTNARVWDLAVNSGAEVATVPAPAYAPGGAVFLGDGQLVAAASGGNTVTLWDAARQRAVRTLGGELPADAANPRRLLVGLRSGPSVRLVGFRFPVASDDDDELAIHTWDWRTGQVVDRLATPDARGAVWLSDDGALAASGLDGERIAILDVARGRDLAVLTGQTGNTGTVEFSADGATVAVGGSDGSVRLWDARDGRELVTLRGHIGAVEALDFSRDGSRLVSAGSDGFVRVWALRLDDLEDIARDSLTRGLTTDECQRYLHVDHCPSG